MKAEFAWPGGDCPGNLEFRYKPSEPVIEALRDALVCSFAPIKTSESSIRALVQSNEPAGRYRLSTPDASWFIRVSSRIGNPELEKSIADYLFRRGVNVNPLLIAGEILRWNGQIFRIDVRPMIEGRHFNGSTDDLRQLAATVAGCHRALADFPRAFEVRAAAAARSERLARIRDGIAESLKHGKFKIFCEHASWAMAHRDWLGEMVKHFEPQPDRQLNAQCVHGEIHQGNVLFQHRDGAAVLVDFEESTHLYVPPVWDLAFLVQRFCLSSYPFFSEALRKVEIVVEAYGSHWPKLATTMRQAAWLAVATIIDLRIRYGVVTPVEECEKFVQLERQAYSYAGVL